MAYATEEDSSSAYLLRSYFGKGNEDRVCVYWSGKLVSTYQRALSNHQMQFFLLAEVCSRSKPHAF